MKSILTASICTAVLALALPASAADTMKKPMHHHHGKMADHMQGPKTHSKRAGDPSTEDLNAKSLDAARGGSTTSTGMAPAAPMSPPAGSGTGAMTTPSNAPQGQ